jgi:PAS domain S-box-containing protein
MTTRLSDLVTAVLTQLATVRDRVVGDGPVGWQQNVASALSDSIQQLQTIGRCAALLDQLPLIFWTTDTTLSLTEVFGPGLQALDLEPDQVRGQPLAAYFGTDDPDLTPLAAHRLAVQGQPSAYEVTSRGQVYACRVEPLHGVDESVVGTAGMALNITAYKHADLARQAAEDHYDDLFERALEGIFQITLGRARVRVNPAFARMLGYDSPEAVEADLQALGYAHFIPSQADRAQLRHLFQGRGEVRSFELQLRRKDARSLWVSVNARAVRDAAGSIRYFEGMLEDITARKQVEAEMRFLAEASRLLASSLDYHETLSTLARLAIPSLGDWCVVDMLEGAVAQRLAVACADTDHQALAQRLWQQAPSLQVGGGVGRVLRTGVAEIGGPVPPEQLSQNISNLEHRHAIQALNCRSYMAVPLLARDQILGAMTFLATDAHAPYGTADLQLAERLAHVAALAVENARLYRAEQQARAEATAAEARYRSLVQDLDAIVWEADPETLHVTFVSRQAEVLLGYPTEQWLTLPGFWLNTLVHPGDRAHVIGCLRAVTHQHRPSDFEYQAIAVDGRLVCLRTIAHCFQDPLSGNSQLRGVMVDMTERLAARLALQESERRFREMAENIQEVFWFYNLLQGDNYYISPAFEMIWGRSAASLPPFPAGVLETIHPDERPLVAIALKHQRQDAWSDLIYRVIRPDGAIRWVHDRAFSMRDESGQLVGLCGVAADITDRKIAEEAERQQRELAEALSEAAAVINGSLDLDIVLDQMLEQVRHIMRCRFVNIMLVAGEQAIVTRQTGYDETPERLVAMIGMSLPLRLPSLQRMRETGQALLVPDTAKSQVWQELPGLQWIASYLGVPLCIGQQVLAFVNLNSEQPYFFDTHVALRLQAFATHAAVALQNALLFKQERREQQESRLLAAISHALNEQQGFLATLQQIVDAAQQTMAEVGQSALYVLDERTQQLRCIALASASHTASAAARLPVGIDNGFEAQVLTTGQLLKTGDVYRDEGPLPAYLAFDACAFMAAPIHSSGKPLGVITVESPIPDAFSQTDERFLLTLGVQAALALEEHRVAEREAQRRRTATALVEAGAALNQSLELEAVLDQVITWLPHLIPCEAATVLLVADELARVVRSWDPRMLPADLLFPFTPELPLASPGLQRILSDHPHLSANTAVDPAWERMPGAEWIGSLVVTPLVVGQECIGFLNLHSAQANFFDSEAMAVLQVFASHTAIAIKNTQRFALEQHQRQESQRRAAIMRTFSETLDQDLILQLLMQMAQQVVPQLTGMVVHLVNETGILLEPVASAGEVMEAHQAIFRLTGLSRLDQILAEGEAIRQPEVQHDQDTQVFSGSLVVGAWLAVPLQRGNRCFGRLTVQSSLVETFSAQEAQLLNELAAEAAVALNHARLFEVERRRVVEAVARQQIAQAISTYVTLDELLPAVVAAVQQSLHYEVVQVYLQDPSGTFELKAAAGARGEGLWAWGLVEQVAQSNQPALMQAGQTLAGSSARLTPALFSVAAVPVQQSQGRGALVVATSFPTILGKTDLDWLHDVGHQLSMALEKVQLYQDLQQALEQEQMMRSHLIAADRLAAMGQMAASIAHEINNPLQSIQGSLELLSLNGLDTKKQSQYLSLAREEIERLAGIVQRVLEFQRLPAIQKEQVYLHPLLDNVLLLCAKSLEQRNVTVLRDWDAALGAIPAVDMQLRQVFLNLILNAIHAMPAGGELLIQTELLSLGDERWASITVSDEGVGIPSEHLEKIFEPFFSTKATGTGLGLWVVQTIIAHHGGLLRIQSQVEHGTTVEIWLPVSTSLETS